MPAEVKSIVAFRKGLFALMVHEDAHGVDLDAFTFDDILKAVVETHHSKR